MTAIERTLQANPDLTGVCIVHCETSTGVIHPVESVGKLIQKHAPNAFFFVDAMSSFGAIPLNLESSRVTYLVSSANKCIEGVPGFSYVIANINHLLKCKGQARGLSLDIVDQYENLEKTGQFRFTPATHAMLAFRKALEQMEKEGGVVGRADRYFLLCSLQLSDVPLQKNIYLHAGSNIAVENTVMPMDTLKFVNCPGLCFGYRRTSVTFVSFILLFSFNLWL